MTSNIRWKLNRSKDGQSHELVLGAFDSMLWGDDSPAATELRAAVRQDATVLASSMASDVTIYSDEGHSLETVSR